MKKEIDRYRTNTMVQLRIVDIREQVKVIYRFSKGVSITPDLAYIRANHPDSQINGPGILQDQIDAEKLKGKVARLTRFKTDNVVTLFKGGYFRLSPDIPFGAYVEDAKKMEIKSSVKIPI
jgi:hypothetical protein